MKLQGTFVNGYGQARWNIFPKPESKKEIDDDDA